eukprot:m51a1_g10549 hypothetical protein (281) ;mRNA; r:33675-34636
MSAAESGKQPLVAEDTTPGMILTSSAHFDDSPAVRPREERSRRTGGGSGSGGAHHHHHAEMDTTLTIIERCCSSPKGKVHLPNTPLGRLRGSLMHAIESKKVEMGVVVLILLDLAVLIADIIVEDVYSKDVKNTIDEDSAEWISKDEIEQTTAGEKAHLALAYASIVILCILGLQILVEAFCYGLEFFKRPMMVLDLCVIAASLTLELALEQYPAIRDVSGLLVIARLWRIVRVTHGVMETVEEAREAHLEKLEEEMEEMRKENEELKARIKQLTTPISV